MPVIHLQTLINVPADRVFDLARSIDAHQDTAADTAERAVDGITSGLLGPGEDVTWEARHFGVRQRLRVRLTQFDRPTHFQDVMVEGAFRQMIHDHSFTSQHGRTLMTDRFDFNAPLGFLGTLAEWLFLTGYLRRFLETRNAILKTTAESEEWKKYLPPG